MKLVLKMCGAYISSVPEPALKRRIEYEPQAVNSTFEPIVCVVSHSLLGHSFGLYAWRRGNAPEGFRRDGGSQYFTATLLHEEG